MAGYVGTKAVNLSTTAATVGGDADIGGDLTVDTSTLHVDSANNRVGIGTSSPSRKLTVFGSNNTTNFEVGDASGGASFNVYNNTTNSSVSLGTGGSSMSFAIAGSDKVFIDSSGHAIIPAGVTLGTSAGTYAAANTLDDYEEGTFTPNFGGATGNPTVTFVTNEGYYRKVGDLVFVQGRMTLSSASGGSGSLEIDGLPFTPVADAVLSVTRLQGLNINVSASGPIGILVGPDFVYYTSNTTGNHSVLQASHLTNSTSINFSGCYAI